MQKKLIPFIVFAIIGASLYLWWFSDSKVIHRNTESLMECFEKDSSDGRFGGAVSTTTFKALLDDNVYFKYERGNLPYASLFSNSIDKDFLIQSHSALVNSAGIVTITNKDIVISSITSSDANVTVSFHIQTEKTPQNFNHDIKCELTYIKKDDDWKISQALIK